MTHPSSPLSGRSIAITGGCGALGIVIAREVGARGASLLLLGRRPESAVRPQIEYLHGVALTGDIAYSQADTRDPESVERALASVSDLGGAVVNAGITQPQPVLDMTRTALEETLHINTAGGALFAQASARHMIRTGITGGSIVVMSSCAADRPGDNNAAYGASKAALEAFARSMAFEVAPSGVRVNALQCGLIDAGMARAHLTADPHVAARAAVAIPLGRLGTPQDVAAAVAFLLGPESSWMTGATLRLDGGASIAPAGLAEQRRATLARAREPGEDQAPHDRPR